MLQEISRSYAQYGELWRQHLSALGGEVEELLRRQHLHISIKMRVKTFESLSEKRSFISRSTGEPDPLIGDLLGLRIVVPFQGEVELVIGLLREHYKVGKIERKSEKLSFREFAYDSVHIELPLQADLPLPRGCIPVIEVQVRTILQDAWAEVEHELIYKNHFRFPNNDSIRKKLAAVNASLSLADMIFQEIRDAQKALSRWGQDRFQSMLDQATALPVPDLEKIQHLLPQATLPGIENPLAGSQAEIERHLMAGLKAHNDKDYWGAVKHYSQVLALNPEIAVRSIVFNHRGIAYFMLNRETLALSDFDRSFQCDKNNYRALNYRAMVLRRMGYVDVALECFSQSLDIAPNQAEVYFLRGQTLSEVDRLDDARADLRRCLELDPGHSEAGNLLGGLAGPHQKKAPDTP